MDIGLWPGSDGAPDAYSAQVDTLDVPYQLEVLEDGRDSIVIGDVAALSEHTHLQGDNMFGFQGTCGLCSCQDVLGQFGLQVSENDMVLHATERGQCAVTDDVASSGGTSAETQAQLLSDYGIPASVENAGSLEDLAVDVEQDRGVIIEANAGVLWDDATYYGNGGANHAVTVTGVARDPSTGEIQGFYINDSGSGAAGRFVNAETMQQAWLDAGGTAVTTDVTRAGVAAFTGGTN
jgi:hypothetical protein